MNASELTIEVKRVLRDPAILDETILSELNTSALYSASQVRIPTLITDDTVEISAGDAEGDLPPDFHRDLLSAYSTTTNKPLNVRTNKGALDALHSKTKTGDIEDVAVSGALLLVGPMAAADEIIDIKYYAKPPELVNDNDTLDEHIPAYISKNLLCGRVIIEKLPQTDNDPVYIEKMLTLYVAKFQEAEAMLRDLYPDAQKRKPIRHRKVRTF